MHACITFFDWTACMHAWAPMFLILSCACSFFFLVHVLTQLFCAHLFLSLHAWSDTIHAHLHACLEFFFSFSLDVDGMAPHMSTCMYVCSLFYFSSMCKRALFFSQHLRAGTCSHSSPLFFFFFFWFFSFIYFSSYFYF